MPSASGRTTTHAPTSPLPSSIPSKNEALGVSRTIMCLRAISDALRCASVEIPAVRPSEATLVECAPVRDARAEVCRNSLRLVLIAGCFLKGAHDGFSKTVSSVVYVHNIQRYSTELSFVN